MRKLRKNVGIQSPEQFLKYRKKPLHKDKLYKSSHMHGQRNFKKSVKEIKELRALHYMIEGDNLEHILAKKDYRRFEFLKQRYESG